MSEELSGVALDEAVARAVGHEPGADYSTSWRHAGPLIERHRITIVAHNDWQGDKWSATVGDFSHYIDESLPFSWGYGGADGSHGPTALVAAMRALVRSMTPNVEAERPPTP